ncbi:MAG: DUF1206 domain-containing protein [Acidimicrobiaceae bacterium]|nr:DUF1206 domain-containing protein [Acidimicrobiaceae bacterium]
MQSEQLRTGPSGGDHVEAEAQQGLSLLARLGLAGRTCFYLILTALTIRIALFGGGTGRSADAQGALTLVSRAAIGKAAIGAVAAGFVFFGVGRLVGAVQDKSAGKVRRAMTVAQGLFYIAMAYVPASFLAGNVGAGSQQEQRKTAARVLYLPGGRAIVIGVGVVLVLVCVQQIRGAVREQFREGLDLAGAPRWVRKLASVTGVVGIPARALVFLPVGVFLIVAAVVQNPHDAYGTDGELLRLSGHVWGLAVLAATSAGLAVFVVFSAIETRYRKVITAR